jgi:hypothetical protein
LKTLQKRPRHPPRATQQRRAKVGFRFSGRRIALYRHNAAVDRQMIPLM